MPNWLWRSIIATSLTISFLAISQWASCRFYVLPAIWPIYVNGALNKDGKTIDPQPMGCNDVDARTITVMMGVLTTLISLSRRAE
jgi:hypothetical protein